MTPVELRMVRIALGTSVHEFGALVGADLQAVAAWERGEAVPSPLQVQRIRALQAKTAEGGETAAASPQYG